MNVAVQNGVYYNVRNIPLDSLVLFIYVSFYTLYSYCAISFGYIYKIYLYTD